MIEIANDDKYSDFLQSITKTTFDLLRNTLIVATIGYFSTKTKSQNLAYIYIFSQMMLGVYVTSLFIKLRFSNSFFKETRGAQIFRLIISGIVFVIASGFINYGSGLLVREAIAAQTRQIQDARCSFIPG